MKRTEENKDWLKYENQAYDNGYEAVCGVDEAGRGPLAGPVFAAAVILPKGFIVEGANDSKKLSEKKREALFEKIKEEAVSYSIAMVDEGTIDEVNILNATFMAMNDAINNLSQKPDFVMIDGNKIPPLDIDAECIVKGDAKSMSIACASILAKVSRDRLLYKYAEEYPMYGFDKHKGYGTKVHREAILKYGPCPYHRKSFLKKLYK